MQYIKCLFFSCFLPIQVVMASVNLERINQVISQRLQLEHDDYHLILKKLAPHIEEIPDSLMDDFLLLVQEVTLIPVTQQKFSMIGENDAVIAAPEFHELIFENEFSVYCLAK